MQSFSTEPDDAQQSTENSTAFPVCPITALPPGGCRRFALPNGDELAIYNVNGEFYATDNGCPHWGASLVEGQLCGHIIECSLHGWQFDVRTGECLTVSDRIKTYVVVVEDGMVKLEL